MHFPPKRQEAGKKITQTGSRTRTSVEANFVSTLPKGRPPTDASIFRRHRQPPMPLDHPNPGGRRKIRNFILSKRQSRPHENRTDRSKGGDR